jgi:thymidylate synthase (FAD)
MKFTSTMRVEVLDHLGSDVDIARAAWVSTLGERADEGDPARVGGLINMLMRDRHGSPFEQGLLRLRVSAPIAVFREHQRHRIASYNEKSGRYEEMLPEFYVPPAHRPLIQRGKPGAYEFHPGTDAQHTAVTDAFIGNSKASWNSYQDLLARGVAREVSRMVLPINLMSTMVVAMNPRALMNFLSLRVKSDSSRYPTFPMWEIEQVALQYEAAFATLWPRTWEAFITHGRVAP